MHKDLIVKTRSLAGTSDLTLLAPIKSGLVESIESVSHKTRVKRLLEALHLGRSNSQEYALLRPFSDAVERVGRIHSVRVTVFEPEDKVLLAVSFDGSWESYVRVLWQKVGALLDVIFCDTEGYPLACASSFETWSAWVRHVQRETQFYYGMPGLTVDDVHSLRKEESLHLRFPGQESTDLLATRQTVRSAEDQAWDTARHVSPAAVVETVRQGLQSLSYIHRLTTLYPPATMDGRVLQRAARQLLRELVGLAENTHVIDSLLDLGKQRFEEQIAWLLTKDPLDQRRVPDVVADAQPLKLPQLGQVQAGIATEYGPVSHGALVLVGLADAAAATTLLTHLRRVVTPASAAPQPDGLVINAAFTHEGLRICGLGELELACLPMEFRQGMEARAATLGDFRHNHPRRWSRPERCDQRGRPDPAAPRVQMAEVHVLVQMRAMLTDDSDALDDEWLFAGRHGLSAALSKLLSLASEGVCVLSVQPMRRFSEKGQIYEHFGFADGISQPTLDPAQTSDVYDNRVPLGEVLLGYHNQADFAPTHKPDGELPPDEQADGDPQALADARESVRELLLNGSFLVVRKLRQDVAALESAVAEAVKQTGIPRADLLAKMMGRRPDGAALAASKRGNDFDYDGDSLGRLCPFHAHVRRANPRTRDTSALRLPPGGRIARIVRRGMSYGPRFDRSGHDTARNAQPRGLMFMAYNASIGEQFETVQRWLSGGNSTGGYSEQSDPFLGVAPVGQRRQFRFEYEGRAVSIALDGADRPLEDAHPFVQVEWGAYLLAPSIGALDKLLDSARLAAASKPTCPWSGRRGEKLLRALPAGDPMPSDSDEVAQWKHALEDAEAVEKFRSADLWAAVREQHGGVLRTPYGVLVAERSLALQVLCHPERFSVRGYQPRMNGSIGEIFLGQDPDANGRDPRALATNTAIHGRSRAEGYELTSKRVRNVLDTMTRVELGLAQQARRPEWELNLNLRELIDQALAALCEAWFGLQPEPADPADPRPGALRWDLDDHQPPRYPGHFTPPSRCIFQPHPGEFAQRMGELAGQRLKAAMLGIVRRHRAASTVPQAPGGRAAPLAQAMFQAFDTSSDEELASGLVGVMMGMLPTLDGNLVRVLDEWLRDGSFWRLRRELVQFGPAPTLANAEEVLLRPLTEAMQLRPTPELIWRTAVHDDSLGNQPVRAGEVVVVSLVSVTQALAESGQSDEKAGHLQMVFGGYGAGSATHACPGYEAAMGAMLGTLAALLAAGHPMRPSAARLAVDFVGTADALPVAPAAPMASRLAKVQTAELALTARGEGRGWLLAEGDSWFDDLNQFGVSRKNNLLRILDEDFDYRVEQVAQSGDGLADMAAPAQLAAFDARLRRMAALGRRPRAILLSAGGNDVVGKDLAALLRPGAKRPVEALCFERVRARVGGPCKALGGSEPVEGLMSAALRRIVGHYAIECRKVLGREVPIMLHGYDHPVPDGRNLFGVPRSPMSWLYPAFAALGYGDDPDSVDNAALSLRTGVMGALIDVLNEMQQWVAGDTSLAGLVQWVDLRHTLSTDADLYRHDWANELHPTEAGFAALAARLARAIG